eukprot:scaffold65465_cov90-Phaeocystis_antarctica.AAC.1
MSHQDPPCCLHLRPPSPPHPLPPAECDGGRKPRPAGAAAALAADRGAGHRANPNPNSNSNPNPNPNPNQVPDSALHDGWMAAGEAQLLQHEARCSGSCAVAVMCAVLCSSGAVLLCCAVLCCAVLC